MEPRSHVFIVVREVGDVARSTDVEEESPDALKDSDAVGVIKAEMSELAFKKGGWVPSPTYITSAQMSAPYAAASQVMDGTVLAAQFMMVALKRDEV
jgi:aconitate decarboxylase